MSLDVRKQVAAIRRANCAFKLTRKSTAGDVVMTTILGKLDVYYLIGWVPSEVEGVLPQAVCLRDQEGFLVEHSMPTKKHIGAVPKSQESK